MYNIQFSKKKIISSSILFAIETDDVIHISI